MSKENTLQIGIIGGGQLAQMMCLAAQQHNIATKIYSDLPAIAAPFAEQTIIAPYADQQKFAEFVDSVSAICFEFENIPLEPLKKYAAQHKFRPNLEALRISQDRLIEKEFFNDLGFKTAPYQKLCKENYQEQLLEFKQQAIIKTTRFGYDGKGQFKITNLADLQNFQAELAQIQQELIIEDLVPFSRELSIIAARDIFGHIIFYPLAENIHENGILRTTIFPAADCSKLQIQAEKIATATLEKLDYVGVLAIEFFVVGDELLINEFAPRPHNSGHYTIDGATVSQFEQAILAAAGKEVIKPELKTSGKMHNLLGEEISQVAELKSKANHFVHNYGKATSAPLRKMGHYTVLD